MPEPTDFDQIAQRMADLIYEEIDGCDQPRTSGPSFIMNRTWYMEQLRQVWNVRGAADAHLFADEMDHRDIRERIATVDSAPIAKA